MAAPAAPLSGRQAASPPLPPPPGPAGPAGPAGFVEGCKSTSCSWFWGMWAWPAPGAARIQAAVSGPAWEAGRPGRRAWDGWGRLLEMPARGKCRSPRPDPPSRGWGGGAIPLQRRRGSRSVPLLQRAPRRQQERRLFPPKPMLLLVNTGASSPRAWKSSQGGLEALVAALAHAPLVRIGLPSGFMCENSDDVILRARLRACLAGKQASRLERELRSRVVGWTLGRS